VTNLVVTNRNGVALRKSVTWDYANLRTLTIAYRVGTNTAAVASYGFTYVTNDDRLATVTRADGTCWTYAYNGLGQLASGKKTWTNGVAVMGRQFEYAYDSAGNTVKAGPLNSSSEPRYTFTASDDNLHTGRGWGSEIDVTGTAATNARVVVNTARAQRQDEWFRATLTVSNNASSTDQEVRIYAARHDTGLGQDVVASRTGRVFVAKSVEAPAYNAKGELLTDSRRQFVFNGLGWLVQATTTGRVQNVRVKNDYDPDGRRVRKTVLAANGSAWVTNRVSRFYYDQWNLIAETVDDSTVTPSQRTTRTYLWGLDLAGQRDGKIGQESGGIGGLLAITEVAGAVTNVFYPLCDHHGTIEALLDGQTGAVVAEYEYDPYGVLLAESGAKKDSCPLRFMSKYWDAETGLYYFGFRYFDPAATKWLTPDPLQEEGGLNLTAFCRNDPVNKTDPSGLSVEEVESCGYFPSGYVPYLKSDASLLSRNSWEHLSVGAANLFNLVGNTVYGGLGAIGWVGEQIDESPKTVGFNKSISQMQEPLGPLAFVTGGGELKAMMALGTVARLARVESTLGKFAALERTLVRVEEAASSTAAKRTLAQGADAGSRPARFVRQLERVGNPQQYVRRDYENIVVQNKAGDLALFRGQATVEIPPSTTPILHTHTRTPIPSTLDFLAAPVGEVQYLEAPQGGVLYMRQTLFRGLYTEPGTGLLHGEWTAW